MLALAINVNSGITYASVMISELGTVDHACYSLALTSMSISISRSNQAYI